MHALVAKSFLMFMRHMLHSYTTVRWKHFVWLLHGSVFFGACGHMQALAQVLYMMSLGFSPASTASVAVASTVGSAAGFIAGGAVGDWTARRWPNAARPLANQVCLALTIPLVVLALKGMPQSSARASGWPGSADSWAWVGAPRLSRLPVALPKLCSPVHCGWAHAAAWSTEPASKAVLTLE